MDRGRLESQAVEVRVQYLRAEQTEKGTDSRGLFTNNDSSRGDLVLFCVIRVPFFRFEIAHSLICAFLD